ncbi:MAG: Uma2 family endonuclease, partial [Bacteroidota bacterium]
NALDSQSKACAVYSSDQKVYIPKTNGFVYPDCTIVCGEEDFHEESQIVLTNPCLLIEVLSESTKDYDRGAKFEGYRSIPSFKEYVLVWQTIPKIQSWYKEAENLWRISSKFGLDQTIYIHTLNCEIAVAEVYKRVKALAKADTPEAY